jgi:dihydrofolate reductase
MLVSLDGFIEGPNRELDWPVIDEELHTFINHQQSEFDTYLYGRRLYEVMTYWETADTNLSAPAYELEFARIWKQMPKIVFSKTLEQVQGNARLVRDNITAEVTKLKAQPGKNMDLGGPNLTSTFMRLGLIDEYRLFVQPIVLGSGTPFFPALDNPIKLRLVETRTFAGALDWPGWCRLGQDEPSVLQALLDYGSRYAKILHNAEIAFQTPDDLSAFRVVERLAGSDTTDFGAPDVAPSADMRAINDIELRRYQALLEAYWQAFDAMVIAAAGKELQKGPRGGGRDLEGIIDHVLGADAAYLGSLGQRFKRNEAGDRNEELERTRQAILRALSTAVRGELPERGPCGGVIWKPRYFVRRVAWHLLDHIWEIEDRAVAGN